MCVCVCLLGWRQGRASKDRCTFLLAARQRPLLPQRRMCQSVLVLLSLLLLYNCVNVCNECVCRLRNGHINFEKFWQLAKQVTEFMTWKQVTCPFEKHSKVIHYLQTGTILSENGNSAPLKYFQIRLFHRNLLLLQA